MLEAFFLFLVFVLAVWVLLPALAITSLVMGILRLAASRRMEASVEQTRTRKGGWMLVCVGLGLTCCWGMWLYVALYLPWD